MPLVTLDPNLNLNIGRKVRVPVEKAGYGNKKLISQYSTESLTHLNSIGDKTFNNGSEEIITPLIRKKLNIEGFENLGKSWDSTNQINRVIQPLHQKSLMMPQMKSSYSPIKNKEGSESIQIEITDQSPNKRTFFN